MFARNPNKKYSFGSSPLSRRGAGLAQRSPSRSHSHKHRCVRSHLSPEVRLHPAALGLVQPCPPGVDGPAPGPSASPSFTESEWNTAHGADAELACAPSGARAEERLTLGCRGTSGRTRPVPRGSGGRRVRAAGGPGRVFGTRLPGRNGLWEETGALGRRGL